MKKLPARYGHFLYGGIQSWITTGVATGVVSFGYEDSLFWLRWMKAWATSWALMVPVVVFVAPAIRYLTLFLTRDES